jgi:hypothetical protein
MYRITMVMVVLIAIVAESVVCQNIELIGKQKAVVINGGLGFNYSSTITNDSNRIAMPAFWSANLNLNIDIYGFVIPISAVLTNGKVNLVNSFSQFGMSPHYKWITLHAGYRQYSYSPFTVGGQTFFGGGIELHPWLFRLGFFTGQLHKAVAVDSLSQSKQKIPGSYPTDITTVNGTNYYSAQPAYTRTAWGAKFGFGTDRNFVDLIVFKGQDIASSLTDAASKLKLLPEENLILGLNCFQRIGKHISFAFNGAASLYTYNTDVEPITGELPAIPLKGILNQLIVIRPTTQLQWAGDVSLGLNFKNFSLQTQYKHIEPYFKSMGIGSYLSDLEMITIQPSWSLFKQKIRFTNMLQFQHDNINNYKEYTTSRMLINSSVSFNLSNNWGFDVSYNNYDMTQKKQLASATDSTQSHQLSNTFTLSPRYIFNNSNFTDVVSVVGSFTDMDGGKQSNGTSNRIENFYSTLNNTLALFKSSWSINAGLNYNDAKTALNDLLSYGFIAGVSKSLFENKLGLSYNNTLLWNMLDGKPNGNTYSIDLTGNYCLFKKHNLGLGFNYLFSPANGVYNTRDFQQKRITFSYQYNF